MRVSKSGERASKEAEMATMAAGRASEAAGRALGCLGVPQRQLGGHWKGRGGRKDNDHEGNNVNGKKIS